MRTCTLTRPPYCGAVGSVEWAPPAGGMRNLRGELTARCRGKPLATLVDEAHTLDLEVGRAQLNASQQVRADAPFLLVLAGTPGLAAHLGAIGPVDHRHLPWRLTRSASTFGAP